MELAGPGDLQFFLNTGLINEGVGGSGGSAILLSRRKIRPRDRGLDYERQSSMASASQQGS